MIMDERLLEEQLIDSLTEYLTNFTNFPYDWTFATFLDVIGNGIAPPFPMLYYLGQFVFLQQLNDGWLPHIGRIEDDIYYCPEIPLKTFEEAVVKAFFLIRLQLAHKQLLPLLNRWTGEGKLTSEERLNLIKSIVAYDKNGMP